jgi:hypothetical protein
MHFSVLVICDQKPTEKVLGEILAPFIPEKFDWWTLGGRYTGHLTPHDLDNTITGGDNDIPAGEVAMAQMVAKATDGMATFERPSGIPRGDGVDALQLTNLKKYGAPCVRVIKDGKFFEAFEPDTMAANRQLTEEELEHFRRWLPALMSDVGDHEWLAVIDCHW